MSASLVVKLLVCLSCVTQPQQQTCLLDPKCSNIWGVVVLILLMLSSSGPVHADPWKTSPHTMLGSLVTLWGVKWTWQSQEEVRGAVVHSVAEVSVLWDIWFPSSNTCIELGGEGMSNSGEVFLPPSVHPCCLFLCLFLLYPFWFSLTPATSFGVHMKREEDPGKEPGIFMVFPDTLNVWNSMYSFLLLYNGEDHISWTCVII